MELLKDSASKVFLEGEQSWTVYASWKFGSDEKGSLVVDWDPTEERWQASLPYLMNEGTVSIQWSGFIPEFGSFEREDVYDVVTPILSIREIKAIVEDANDEEAREIEAAVRHIINAHCGQTFGKFVGTRSVSGSGEPNLRMPQRLISYTSINGGTYWSDLLALRGDGWFLIYKHTPVPTLKADYDGWHYNPSSGVINAPRTNPGSLFIEHQEYVINGVWGWQSVPDAVKEAAKLLVNDYSCADSLYRDRFLTSMTAADWRIQFHEGAFSNTGNVRANQLLSEFVLRRGWVVI